MDLNVLKDKILSRQANKTLHLTDEQIRESHLAYIDYHKKD